MTETEEEEVVFTVSEPNVSNILAGDYPGFVESLLIWRHGFLTKQRSRCMLQITRDNNPQIFSPNSSRDVIDADVTIDVNNGRITYK
jgi:hypothetical protein